MEKAKVVYYEVADAKQSFFAKAARKVKWKVKEGYEWTVEHKEDIVCAAGIVIAGVTAFAGLQRAVNNSGYSTKKQSDMRDMRCYDPSAGHYWELRRKLSNREWGEVEARRRDGERIGDILDDMKVLK